MYFFSSQPQETVVEDVVVPQTSTTENNNNNNNNNTTIIMNPEALKEEEMSSSKKSHYIIDADNSDDASSDDASSTACTSLDDNTTSSQRISLTACSQSVRDLYEPSKAKKSLWKDKGGASRYTTGEDVTAAKTDDNNKVQNAIVAGAVTSATLGAGAAGLVLLGPVGLALAGVGAVGSGAASAATIMLNKRRQGLMADAANAKYQSERVLPTAAANTNKPAPTRAAPMRSFSQVKKAQLQKQLANGQAVVEEEEVAPQQAPKPRRDVPLRSFSGARKQAAEREAKRRALLEAQRQKLHAQGLLGVTTHSCTTRYQ